MNHQASETALSGSELVLTRVLNAPRELVFKAWTEPERLAQWWGPAGFEMGVVKLDLRPGGAFHYSMRVPGGEEMWGKFTYEEIAPPERIVFRNCFADSEGNAISSPMIPNWPLEIHNTLTLEEKNGKTTLTLRGYPIDPTSEQRAMFASMIGSMEEGWGGTFRQLEEHLAGVR